MSTLLLIFAAGALSCAVAFLVGRLGFRELHRAARDGAPVAPVAGRVPAAACVYAAVAGYVTGAALMVFAVGQLLQAAVGMLG